MSDEEADLMENESGDESELDACEDIQSLFIHDTMFDPVYQKLKGIYIIYVPF